MLAFEMVSQVSGFSTATNGTTTAAVGQRSASYKGQNIGSLLSDSEGNIIGWGFNTNRDNSTRHGEVNLIGNFLAENPGTDLPNGGTIYTTLEPCEMCSGFIARAVRSGYLFRVIYGQRDVNVSSTALQRRANPAITMTASSAALATPSMIKSGSTVGVKKQLATAIAEEQTRTGIIATTQFLKGKSTYEAFFGMARPQWWLYMWDYLVSTLPGQDKSKKEEVLLKDPAVLKVNKDLDVIHMLVEFFMQAVKRQGATG
jgi:tRNA(Arg) A34 adenosine deaminase TadA